ncbi:ribbon-helix-helix protein, CopG family [Demequina sp. SYSU T00192]|uniref:Ribbon-helix-helix protein, CopG family n=1 Tax=Demequina litoralis TaxID=3051660 RepID=A0ABT8G7U0_9MICO|nr:ribbon-helix-helix protein, CopG family [Demequina sp. SYSU T00192]MDN4475205.1 ribbon-helix-helix protein, CopG family [Demequina sp. SYSU T00192]
MAVRKVAVTLPEELFEIVERARAVEHRTRSEVIQEALRTHFGEAVYVPSAEERHRLLAGLDEAAQDPERSRDWAQVRAELHPEQ